MLGFACLKTSVTLLSFQCTGTVVEPTDYYMTLVEDTLVHIQFYLCPDYDLSHVDHIIMFACKTSKL